MPGEPFGSPGIVYISGGVIPYALRCHVRHGRLRRRKEHEEKEPDNEYDKEAIKVTYEGLGKIGYVANSSYTVIGDSMSAGRIYDKIGKKAKAKVVLVTDHGAICSISKKSLLDNQKKVKKSEAEIEE